MSAFGSSRTCDRCGRQISDRSWNIVDGEQCVFCLGEEIDDD